MKVVAAALFILLAPSSAAAEYNTAGAVDDKWIGAAAREVMAKCQEKYGSKYEEIEMMLCISNQSYLHEKCWGSYPNDDRKRTNEYEKPISKLSSNRRLKLQYLSIKHYRGTGRSESARQTLETIFLSGKEIIDQSNKIIIITAANNS